MSKSKIDQKRALPWRILATVALLAVAFYVLSLHRDRVVASLAALRHANPAWLLLTLAFMALTLVVASLTYDALALHPLRLRETLLIQLAASFVGRLLPAGLGGLGLNGLYLYRRRHTPAEATAVVSVNNLIGMAVHLLLLSGLIVLRPGTVSSLLSRHETLMSWPLVFVVMSVLAMFTFLSPLRRRIARFAYNLMASVKRESLRNLCTAIVLSAVQTATYTALLYDSARAVGIHLSFEQIFVVFSFGMLAGTATPTPGGLVGVEAGLFAGFSAYGIQEVPAGAAVLVFRLVSYWLPLLPGVLALLKARHLRIL